MIQGKAIMIQERQKTKKFDGNQENDTIILVVRDCSGIGSAVKLKGFYPDVS